MRYRWNRLRERILISIAWALPRELVKWCGVRMIAHATTGEWGHLETPAVLATEVLQRWPR